jgi:hypothetical protein
MSDPSTEVMGVVSASKLDFGAKLTCRKRLPVQCSYFLGLLEAKAFLLFFFRVGFVGFGATAVGNADCSN